MEPGLRLNLFIRRIEELRRCKMVRDGFGVNFSLSYDQAMGLSVQLEEPEEDDIRSFLLTFRQFISQREPIYANHIYNVCYRELKSDELRENSVQSRQEWNKAVENSGMGLEFNERDFAPEDIADLWINGHYFHSDPEKIATLEAMSAQGIPIARAYFIDFLVNATRQLVYMGHLVAYGLNNKLFRFQD